MSVSPTVRSQATPPPPVPGTESWWSHLTPLAHAKIFRVDRTAEVDLDCLASLPPPYEVERGPDAVTATTRVLLGREVHYPPWTRDEDLAAIEHDLFVLHWNPRHRLLFCTFTHRSSESLYEEVLRSVVVPGGDEPGYRSLHFDELKNVFHRFSDLQIINVGMHTQAPRATSPTTGVAYQFLAGKGLRGDPKRRTGHVVAIGEADGSRRTLGISRRSKVWGTAHLGLDELATWCDWIAGRLATRSPKLPDEIAILT